MSNRWGISEAWGNFGDVAAMQKWCIGEAQYGVHLILQIADFGLSNLYHSDEYLQTFCGSPLYASPEIVNGRPYRGPEVDTWSLGVLLYTMVHGTMPFDGLNHKTLVQQISTGNYRKPNNPSGKSWNLESWNNSGVLFFVGLFFFMYYQHLIPFVRCMWAYPLDADGKSWT